MNQDRCTKWETRLQEFVDGLLAPEEERRLREHLAACERCRREEGELRRLLTRVAELPREISPPRDLWPAVAERIGERGGRARDRHTAAPREDRRGRRPERRRTVRRWARQAAAAIVFMALGVVLARLVPAGGGPGGGLPEGAPAGRGDAPRAAGARPASARAMGFDEIESEYLRAKEALWLAVYSRHEELSPLTLEIVRRNLLIVDDAIRDLRTALAEDPGNRQLAASLLAQHRRSIHLLQRLTHGRRAEL